MDSGRGQGNSPKRGLGTSFDEADMVMSLRLGPKGVLHARATSGRESSTNGRSVSDGGLSAALYASGPVLSSATDLK